VVLALIIVLKCRSREPMLGGRCRPWLPARPAFDWIVATLLLDTPALRRCGPRSYNARWCRLQLQQPIVLGSLWFAALWGPFFASRWGVVRYAPRSRARERPALYRSVVASKLYNLYRLFRPEA